MDNPTLDRTRYADVYFLRRQVRAIYARSDYAPAAGVCRHHGCASTTSRDRRVLSAISSAPYAIADAFRPWSELAVSVT